VYDEIIECWLVEFEGNTPLHRAAGRGHVSTVKLLLSRGANPKIKNHQGHDVYTVCQNVAVREVLGTTLVFVKEQLIFDQTDPTS
jgi:ankyrin repeat protein